MTLTAEIVKSLLKNHPLGNTRSLEPIPTSGNESWVLITDQERYFFRLCPKSGPRWRSIGEIQAEIDFIFHLRENRIPTPEPIANRNGCCVVSFETQSGYLRRWSLGASIHHPTPAHSFKVGKVLANIHVASEVFSTTYRRDHRWDLSETKKNFQEDIPVILASDFPRASEFVNQYRSNIESVTIPSSLPSGMIHEDLGKRHALWEKDEISAIIDFDRSYVGQYIADLGQTVRGWCFDQNWKHWDNELFFSLIDGYQAVRPLSGREKHALFDAIVFAVLERTLSFSLRSIMKRDTDAAAYAWHSLSDGGPIGLLRKHKPEILSAV